MPSRRSSKTAATASPTSRCTASKARPSVGSAPPPRLFDAGSYELGIGPNKFVARAAALAGGRRVIATQREARRFLAPLPLTLLELDPHLLERLHLLGITSLGDLAALPHGPFVR